MIGRLRSFAFVTFCLLFNHKVQAQTGVIIVVQRSNAVDLTAYEQRLRAELSAEGYLPTTVLITSEPNAAVLVETAKRLGSPAAISVSIREGIISGVVWMVDPKKSGGLLRAVTDYPVNDQAPVVFAVSATDVLHGGLKELGYVQATTPSTSASAVASTTAPESRINPSTATASPPLPPPPVPPTASKPKDRQHKRDWQLDVGGDAIISVTEAPIDFAPSLTFTRRLGLNWALGLSGHIALPLTVTGVRGKADIKQFMAGAWLEYRQLFGTQITFFEFFETGLHYATVNGRSAKPLTNHDAYASTVYHQVGAGAYWNTTSDFGLWLRAGILLPWQSSKVVIVEQVVTQVPNPAVLLGAGMAMLF